MATAQLPVETVLVIEKVRNLVGLCLDRPDNELMSQVDEKSLIQALDRTQPSLP